MGGPLESPIPWGAVLPMQPVALEAAAAPGALFADPAWVYQLKWDGVRMVAFVEGGRVRLQNRHLRDRTATYPEMGELAGRMRGRQAVLDGEVVVMEGTRPSFPRVMEREGARSGASAAALARRLPATFAAFDLLYLDGQDLTGRPFWARRELLDTRGLADWPLAVTPTYEDGAALLEAVRVRGLEGIVAKARMSPYLQGKKSPLWRKVKIRQRLACLVGGYTLGGGGLGALLLGIHTPGAGECPPAAEGPPVAAGGPLAPLLYVGRVGSGLDERTRQGLAAGLPALERPTPPFANPPRLPGLAVRWVEPRLAVEVAFSEWTPDLKLRAPSLLGPATATPGGPPHPRG